METRQRLMDAARRLLATMSPFDLTAAAIAKEARAASATFYVYFDDVQDVLFALSAAAVPEMTDLFEKDTLLRNPEKLDEESLQFIEAFNRVWDRHSDILLYRNLEADRGNPRFDKLRTQTAIPVLDGIADRINKAYPAESRPTLHDSYAEGVVIFCALERLAAATHQYPDAEFKPDELRRAQARVLAHYLKPR